MDEGLGWCWSTTLDWDFRDETVEEWVERSIVDTSGLLIDRYRIMVEEHPQFKVSSDDGSTAHNSVVAEIADVFDHEDFGSYRNFAVYKDGEQVLWFHPEIALKYGLAHSVYPMVLGGSNRVVVFRDLDPRDSERMTGFDLGFPPPLLEEHFRVGQDWVHRNIQEPAERLGPDSDWDMEPELVEYQPRIYFDAGSGETTLLSWWTGKNYWVRLRSGQASTRDWIMADSEPSGPFMVIPKTVARVVLDLFDSHNPNIRDLAGILIYTD